MSRMSRAVFASIGDPGIGDAPSAADLGDQIMVIEGLGDSRDDFMSQQEIINTVLGDLGVPSSMVSMLRARANVTTGGPRTPPPPARRASNAGSVRDLYGRVTRELRGARAATLENARVASGFSRQAASEGARARRSVRRPTVAQAAAKAVFAARQAVKAEGRFERSKNVAVELTLSGRRAREALALELQATSLERRASRMPATSPVRDVMLDKARRFRAKAEDLRRAAVGHSNRADAIRRASVSIQSPQALSKERLDVALSRARVTVSTQIGPARRLPPSRYDRLDLSARTGYPRAVVAAVAGGSQMGDLGSWPSIPGVNELKAAATSAANYATKQAGTAVSSAFTAAGASPTTSREAGAIARTLSFDALRATAAGLSTRARPVAPSAPAESAQAPGPVQAGLSSLPIIPIAAVGAAALIGLAMWRKRKAQTAAAA